LCCEFKPQLAADEHLPFTRLYELEFDFRDNQVWTAKGLSVFEVAQTRAVGVLLQIKREKHKPSRLAA
jgi:hypothetical protein